MLWVQRNTQHVVGTKEYPTYVVGTKEYSTYALFVELKKIIL